MKKVRKVSSVTSPFWEKKSGSLHFPGKKTSVEAPEIIARKSALHNLTLGLGKRTFYIVLNPRHFCWHLRTGGCPKKKKNDTRDICDLHAGYVANKKDESFQQIPRIQTRKNSRRVVGFIHFMGTHLPSLFCLVMDIFFGGPDVCPFLFAGLRCKTVLQRRSPAI